MAIQKQLVVQRFVNETVNFFKLLATNIKDNFDQHGETLIQSSGAIGSLIKLVGQQAIDSYFEQRTTQKLENFGVNRYLNAAMNCAENALHTLSSTVYQGQLDINAFTQALNNQNDNNQNLRLYLNPSFNPAVQGAKQTYLAYLQHLNLNQDDINRFEREFEQGINQSIKDSFGQDYKDHQAEVNAQWFSHNEEHLLASMSALKRIGLQQGESLQYEASYGQWQDCDQLNNNSTGKAEEDQLLVSDLIASHHLTQDHDSWQDVISFIVADFGKGKTVFMKHYAAVLADNYMTTGAGPLPLYFNLNQYRNNKYDADRHRGIIDSCLRRDFNIDIDTAPFNDKAFVFLIDSLDESGDLNQIHDVLTSVHKINKNAPLNSPKHKIIVATRPIDKALVKAIGEYKSKCSKQDHPQFISLHGFKAAQFDHWLKSSIEQNQAFGKEMTPIEHSVGAVLLAGWQQAEFSAYQSLLKNKVLAKEELVKPLFAYILYQLLTNNISIPANGRVGIYLAFLHYITSRAKFVDDTIVSSTISLEDEHRNRKVLHAIAALWCKQRSIGEPLILDKRHINLTLLGKNDPNEQEQTQVEQIAELQFLSHSYFGDNEQQLHFQHQSFAEILLAEYYLKVFLCEALEDEPDLLKTRQYLFVGEPTDATMTFFAELIKLVVASVSAEHNQQQADESVLTARRLLLPTLGSLASPFFKAKLHSASLKGDFYQRKSTMLLKPEVLLSQRWPIDHTVIKALIKLSSDILATTSRLQLAPSRQISALFAQELVFIESKQQCERPDVDKWLAVAMGGLLCQAMSPRLYFFKDENRGRQLFQLMQDAPHRDMPQWIKVNSDGIFQRLLLHGGGFFGLRLGHIDLSGMQMNDVAIENSDVHCNLTTAKFTEVRMEDCLIGSDFTQTKLQQTRFWGCRFSGADFTKLAVINEVNFEESLFNGTVLPPLLTYRLSQGGVSDNSIKHLVGSIAVNDKQLTNTITGNSLITLITSALALKVIKPADITASFEFMTTTDKEQFMKNWPDVLKPLFSQIRHDA